MKKVILFLVVLTTFSSCGKDDKVDGISIDGSYTIVGTNSNPPAIWTFSKGTLTIDAKKRAEYEIKGSYLYLTNSTKTFTYEASFNDDILVLNGVSGFVLGDEFKSKYSFKRYVDK